MTAQASGDREAAELLTELADDRKRVERILRGIEEAYEHGDDPDADDELELANSFERMYPRVVAGLERYGHADRARSLEGEWPKRVRAGLSTVTYQSFAGGGFVDCPAWNLLSDAVWILRDAVTHERTKYSREAEKRAEDREEAAKTRRWQLVPSLITGAVALAALVASNAEKLATLVGAAPPLPHAVWHTGKLVTWAGEELRSAATVECSPRIEGIVTAVAPGEWTLGVLPIAPRPLRLYCAAAAKDHVSETVTVDLSAGMEVNTATGKLPTIVVGSAPRPQDAGTVDGARRGLDGGQSGDKPGRLQTSRDVSEAP